MTESLPCAVGSTMTTPGEQEETRGGNIGNQGRVDDVYG